MDYDRDLVNYEELDSLWQIEAAINNDQPREITYIDPLPGDHPSRHMLLDLSECTRTEPNGEYDGVIGLTNVSGIGVNINNEGDACHLTYL